jgi:peroxiredoxin
VDPTRKVLTVIAVVVAVAVAYLVANRSREKPADQSDRITASDSIPDTTRTEPAELRVGGTFPSVNLVAEPDSADAMANIVSRDVVAGKSALVLFVTQNCDPCNATVKSWSESLAGLPSDVMVLGVINASPEERNGYRVQTDAMFPIYSDSEGTFGRNYGVVIYPTLVGIDASGNIVFVQSAIDPSLTPDAAVALLRSSSGP